MATDGNQLFVGGDFTTVNNQPQQGIAIFPTGARLGLPVEPDHRADRHQHLDRRRHVSFPAVSSQDIGTLNYKIFRDGGKTPIATLTATSWPWALPVLHIPGHRPDARLHSHLHLPGDRRHPRHGEVTGLGVSHCRLDEPVAELPGDGPGQQPVVLVAAERHQRAPPLTPRPTGSTAPTNQERPRA